MAAFDADVVVRALTGGLDIHAFNIDVRERQPARFESAIDRNLLRQLIDLARLGGLVASGAIPLASVDLFEDGHLVRLPDVQKKSGRTGLEVIVERFLGGATIRVRDIDRVDLRLSELVAGVRRRFAAQSQINVYLTPPAKAGFPPHFDITDVFIVQCLGRKRWRVFDDYTSRIDLPLMTTDWEPDRFRPVDAPEAIELSAGDVLYLPRGVMHEAFCADRASMHLTISLTPLTFADLIGSELQRVAAADIRFRRRVPWSVDDDDPAAATRIADAARDCLAQLAQQLNVDARVADERIALQASGPRGDAADDLAAAFGTLFEPSPDEAVTEGTRRHGG